MEGQATTVKHLALQWTEAEGSSGWIFAGHSSAVLTTDTAQPPADDWQAAVALGLNFRPADHLVSVPVGVPTSQAGILEYESPDS